MKTIKRMLSLMLALLLLTLAFTACGGDDSKDTQADTKDTVETDGLNLPELDYEGADINILVGTQLAMYFETDGLGDVVSKAVYERNAEVCDRLGILLGFTDMDGYSSGATAFTTAIRSSAMSDGYYDIVIPTQSFGNTLIVEGIYTNLYDYEYLHFDEDHWWDGYTDQAEVDGKLYTAAGDFTPGALMSLQVLYMNRGFLKDYSDIDDPYELVRNNAWTLEKMLDMCKEVTADLDANGIWDDSDRYGWTMVQNGIAALPTMAGVKYVNKTANGYEYTLASDTSINLLDTVKAAMDNNSIRYFKFDNDAMSTSFLSGKALFMSNSITDVYDIKSSKIDYGILVHPKYDDSQEKYYVGTGGLNVCAITEGLTEERAIRASAVLEAFAYYSAKILTPALFGDFLQGQAAQDVETYEMLETIRECAYYDVGLVYGRVFSVTGMYHQCVTKNIGVATWWAQNKDTAEQTLSDWLISIQNMD